MTMGRRKSTKQKLRVKAKKSLGKAPRGGNDDRKKETDKGKKGQNQERSRADKVQ